MSGSNQASERSLGKRAVRGALHLSGATYLSILLGIGARKILAYLLTPADVGTYQTALSFVDVIFSFSAFSFTSAIINVRDNLISEPLEHLRENVFLLTLGINLLFTVVAFVGAVLFPIGTGGIVGLTLVGLYVVQRVASQFDTFYTQILERELSYGRVSRVTLFSSLILHGVAVAIALLGGGVWAIPVATLLSTLVALVLDRSYVRREGITALGSNVLSKYRPRTARWLWAFGWKVLFNRLFEAWLFRVDNLIVVAILGTAMLGYYAQAFTIAQMPAIALAPIVARVSIAAYAEIQHDTGRLQTAFQFTNFFLIRILVLITVVVMISSEDLIRLFLAPRWQPASHALQALGGFVLITPLFENAKMLLGARLKLWEISAVRAIQLATLAALLYPFAGQGLEMVGWIVSAVSVLGYVLILVFVRREISLNVVQTFAIPVALGILTYVLLNSLGFEAGLSGSVLIRLVLHTVIAFTLVFGIEWVFSRELYREKIGLLLAKIGR